MSCHSLGQLKLDQSNHNVVLVGNPNTGKSVVFQALTGVYADVSNYPGTTVDITRASMESSVVIDTPGVYGISAFNDEERVTRDIALQADVIVNIVNAAQLDRDLFLTLQLADLGIPMVVGVNMMDEAEHNGLHIDLAALEAELGTMVVPLVATTGQGIDRLKEKISSARPGRGDSGLLERIPGDAPQALGVLALEEDPEAAAAISYTDGGLREEIYTKRRLRVNAVVDKVMKESTPRGSFLKSLGKWMIHPLAGLPLLFITLYLMYQFVGVFIAQTVVDLLEETLMGEYYSPWVVQFIGSFVPADSLLGAILIGEFGLLTMTVTYVLGLLLPLIIGFYFMLALLEDSGYLPRIATLLDQLLVKIGLNGRAVIPMILGFGCVTMATITTRVLGSKRERTIATFLLSLAIPCSAQLGVIAALIAPLGFKYVLLYATLIFSVYVLVGTLLDRLLPGRSTDLFIDLPAIRLPRLSNVLKKTWVKTSHFLKEATPLFAVGSLLISLLQFSGLLERIQYLVAPLTVGWLRLPHEAAVAFIMGFIRRDFGVAGLYDMSLTGPQTLVALVTITLFVPCIASVMVIWKERGWKEWMAIFSGTFVTAFVVGGLVARLF